MVANLKERNQKKCHQYWPDTGTQSFGPFKVTITGQEILADYTTRLLSVEVKATKEFVDTHACCINIYRWKVALNLL